MTAVGAQLPPDDVVTRGTWPRPEDGGSLARSGLTSLRGPGSALGCRDGGVWAEVTLWVFGSGRRFQFG